MLVFSARLTAEEGAVLVAAIEGVRQSTAGQSFGAEEVSAADRVEAERLEVDPDSLSLADALIAVARNSLSVSPQDVSGEDRTLVVVHVDGSQLPLNPEAKQDPAGPQVQDPLSGAPQESQEQSGGQNLPGPEGMPGSQVMAAAPVAEGRNQSPADVENEATSHEPQLMSGSLGAVPGHPEGGRVGAGCAGVPVGGVGLVEGGSGLDDAVLARMCCDPVVLALVKSSGVTAVGSGRRTRKISSALRRALRARDSGCRFPGCQRKTHLEAHHVRHWIGGGETEVDNLALLCRFHHMLVHEGGFTVSRKITREGDLHLTFIRPDGARVENSPVLAADPDRPITVQTTYTDDPIAPDTIAPGWRGEPFHLGDAVEALIAAMPDQPQPTHN